MLTVTGKTGVIGFVILMHKNQMIYTQTLVMSIHHLFLLIILLNIRINAGLPNIIGDTGYDVQSNFVKGAFCSSWGSGVVAVFAGTRNTGKQGFDASLSNPVYGSSDTVTPLSCRCKHFIKY